MDIVVGTAGHIDHGKTALVKALTGVDADRLPEEKQRGITIDLGFAELELEGLRIGFVDVPGHERFVKNMLAGAGGIDLVMLVVAADEGVMPQTREHFEICRLLETKKGIVALTKSDLADEELLDLVELDVAELVEGSFLEDAPVIRVSSKTGEGLEDLKKTLAETARGIPERDGKMATRLPIDRSFSIRGFGAVVTGTLTNGSIKIGDEMDLLPGAKRVRVRGLQTHGRKVDTAGAGQRTAVNLGGIDHTEIERGMVLAEMAALAPTQIFDARVEVLSDSKNPLKSRQRVRVHLGTAEVLARLDVLNEERLLEPGSSGLVQIRLEAPAVVVPSDRFIIRRYSPQITIAGGLVLDSGAAKHKRKELSFIRDRLDGIAGLTREPSAVAEFVTQAAGLQGISFDDLRKRTGIRADVLDEVIEAMKNSGAAVEAEKRLIPAGPFTALENEILDTVKGHHAAEPLSTGLQKETLREKTASHVPGEIFREALERLVSSGSLTTQKDLVRLSSHSRELSASAKRVIEKLSRKYADAGLQVPGLEEALTDASHGTDIPRNEARQIFQMLVDSAEVLKVSEEFYFSKSSIEALIAKLKVYAETEAENRLIGVPEFKDLAGISRKYAIPLLEYLDAIKITRRAGDMRLIL
jgi:selenocysteine-specific elongation factor